MVRTMISRRAWIWILGLTGAGLVGYGFRLQAVSNFDNDVRAIMGLSSRGTVAPWAVGGIGVVLLIIALVLLILGTQQAKAPALTAGWHDDPEDPKKLRYFDGGAWTQRTADKA